MAEKVKEMAQSNSSITHIDPVSLHGPLFSEAPEKIPNSEKIKSLLGWTATKGVDEILNEVVEYFKSK